MPAPGVLSSRKLQRHLQFRWWEATKGQGLRLASGNVRGEPFEVVPSHVEPEDPSFGHGTWDPDGGKVSSGALQSAVHKVGEQGGGIVQVPPGTPVVGNVNVEHPDVHIVGSGRGATRLLLEENADYGIALGNFDDTSVRGTVERTSVQHLSFDGRKSIHDTLDQHPPIRSEDVVDFLFHDLLVFDAAGYGIGLVGSDVAHRDEAKLSRIDVLRAEQDGIDVKPGLPTLYMSHVWARESGPNPNHASSGIDLRVADYAYLEHVLAHGNDTHGIHIRSATGATVVIVAGHARNSTVGEGIRNDDAEHARFVGCDAIGNRAGILTGSEGTTEIVGGVARDNGESGIDAQNTTNGNGRITIDGTEVFDNAVNETTGRGILIGAVAKWRVANAIVRPGPNASQERGIQWTDDAPAGVLVGIDAQGHSDADVQNRPTGTAAAANLIGTES